LRKRRGEGGLREREKKGGEERQKGIEEERGEV